MASKGVLAIKIIGDHGPLQKSLDSALGGLKKFGAAAAAVGGAVGGALFAAGKTVDEAFDTIRVGTGATGGALEHLQDDFKEVAKTVPADMGDVGTAIADLNTRLGLTGEPLQDTARQTLELTRLTGGDIAANVQSLSRLFGDWSVDTEDTSETMDQLFRISQASGIAIDQLATQMVDVGAPMRQLGFTFDETAALIAKFEKEGVNSQAVLQGMRQSLGRMAKAGEDPIDTFQRLSEEIAAAGTAGEANAIAVETFGTRAGPDLAAAIREGRFELDEYLDVMSTGEDTILDAADDTRSMTESFNQFKNQALIAIQPVATRFFDSLKAFAERVGPPIISFVETSLVPAFETLAVVFSRLQALATILGGAVTRNAGAAHDAFERLPEPLQELGQTVRDVGRTIRNFSETVTSAVKDVIGWFKTNREEVAGATAGLLADVRPIWNQIVSLVSSAFEAISAVVKVGLGIITEFWDRFGTHLTSSAADKFGRLLTIIKDTLAVITGIFEGFTALLRGDWSALFDAWKSTMTAGTDVLMNMARNFFGAVKTIFGGAVAAVSQLWSGLWAGAKATFQGWLRWLAGMPGRIASAAAGMFGGITDAFRDAINWVIRKWNDFSLTLGGATIDPPGPGPTITIPSVTLSTPDIPTLHDGGVFRAPRSGGEGLALLRDRERVIPPEQGRPQVVQHFHGPVTEEITGRRAALALRMAT